MLIVWADKHTREFREFIRPRLQKCGVEYLVTGEFPKQATPEDVVLSFGTTNLHALQKLGHGIKGRAITSQRGLVLGDEAIRIMVTWDPTAISFDAGRRPELVWDLKLALRLHETGSLKPKLGSYTEVTNFTSVEAELDKALEADTKKLGIEVDLETLGTDYMNPDAWIVAISMTIGEGISWVCYFESGALHVDEGVLINQIDKILNHPKAKIYGANFKFDMLWMAEKWGIATFNAFTMDTTLVGSLLNENRSNSLNLHTKVYTKMGGYDDEFNLKYDKSRMDLVPKEDVIEYAGGDTDAGLRVANKQRVRLVKQPRLLRFYKDLLHPATQAVRKMEQRGMVVNQEEYKVLDDQCTETMRVAEAAMIDLLPLHLRRRYRFDLRPSRPKIISDFLFDKRGLGIKPKMLTPKAQLPATSAEHFEMFADHKKAGPFIQALLEFRKAEKTKSTYIDGFLKHLRSDGRFHPSYMLFRGQFHGDDSKDDDSGGRTGRTSVKEPAYQTIPKFTDWAKPLRRVYIPPPGYVILNVDFSQGELRITACVADEKTMIQTYKDGIDLHLKTGASLNGYDLAEAIEMFTSKDPKVIKLIEAIRQGGKAGNFGLIYGMGVDGFVDYARKSYGVHLTKTQAGKFIRGFFGMYSGLEYWHEDVIQKAHQYKVIESPLGRVRHLPLIDSFIPGIRSKAERQAINAGVQATLTDMGLLAMAEIDQRYPDLWQFGFTHDAISFYILEDEVMMWASRIKEVMENLPLEHFGWKPQLSFPVDIEMGVDNLADLVKVKLAA